MSGALPNNMKDIHKDGPRAGRLPTLWVGQLINKPLQGIDAASDKMSIEIAEMWLYGVKRRRHNHFEVMDVCDPNAIPTYISHRTGRGIWIPIMFIYNKWYFIDKNVDMITLLHKCDSQLNNIAILKLKEFIDNTYLERNINYDLR